MQHPTMLAYVRGDYTRRRLFEVRKLNAGAFVWRAYRKGAFGGGLHPGIVRGYIAEICGGKLCWSRFSVQNFSEIGLVATELTNSS